MFASRPLRGRSSAYAWKNGIALGRSSLYGIDADLHFDAAVDAVLLVTHFRQAPISGRPRSLAAWERRVREASSALRMGYCWQTWRLTIDGNTSVERKC